MDCPSRTSEEAADFFRDFNGKITRQRIPLDGSIELTRRCQFDCIHCYLGEKRSSDYRGDELDTETWKRIIDQVADAGCLFLTFTGGEPVLREDFIEIYTHARLRGMIVTVFTNGYGISDEILSVFSDYKPNAVDITLYGATSETHGRVTRRPGTFDTCIENIHRLIEAGIRVRLKTVLMTENAHELPAIEKMAEGLGVTFRFDAAIFPDFSGDPSPTRYRVDPALAVSLELASDLRKKEWRDFAERMSRWKHSGTLYVCGAGITSFHIDPAGCLHPCILVTEAGYDLAGGDFETGWRNGFSRDLHRSVDETFPCVTCENLTFCGFCPAFFRLESGSETTVSPYLCAIGGLMARELRNV